MGRPNLSPVQLSLQRPLNVSRFIGVSTDESGRNVHSFSGLETNQQENYIEIIIDAIM